MLRLRVVAVLIFGVAVALSALAPAPAHSRALLCGDLFDPVYAIMNNTSDQMGCLGCHIRDQPVGFGPWFGSDRDSVLQTLETGVTPDGMELSHVPVEGGRDGMLRRWLNDCVMPLGGTCWGDNEMAILDAWLMTYE